MAAASAFSWAITLSAAAAALLFLASALPAAAGPAAARPEECPVSPGATARPPRAAAGLEVSLLQQRIDGHLGGTAKRSRSVPPEDVDYVHDGGPEPATASGVDHGALHQPALLINGTTPLTNQTLHAHRIPELRTRASFAASWTLLGSVACIVVIFYLVNFRTYSKQMISTTISIFCAILTFRVIFPMFSKGFRYLLALGACSLGWCSVPSRRGEMVQEILLGFAILVLCFFVAHAVLYSQRESRDNLLSAGLVLSHATAFAAVFVFAEMQRLPPFSHGALLSWLLVPLAVAVLLPFYLLGSGFRQPPSTEKRSASAGHRKAIAVDSVENEAELERQVANMENDVAGFCLAYLSTAALHFHLCGKPMKLHNYLKSHTKSEMWGLLSAGGIFFVATVVLTSILHQEPQDGRRAMELVQSFAAMCMGWCLNFGIEGSFVMAAGADMPPPAALFVIALLTTMLCIFVILVLDVMAEQNEADPVALRAVVTGLGLCAGLAWEKAFDAAMESITEGTTFGEAHPALEKGALGLAIVGLVLPAWRLYIFPRTLEA